MSDRSIVYCLGDTPTALRQLNTTNCRVLATFLSLTLLIPFLACHKRAAAAALLPTAKDSKTPESMANRASRSPVSSRLCASTRSHRLARDEILPVTSPKVWRSPGPLHLARLNRCWPAPRSLCSRVCRSSRSRFAPSRPPSAIWADSSRLRLRRACRSRL
jgi:hypothetical protein